MTRNPHGIGRRVRQVNAHEKQQEVEKMDASGTAAALCDDLNSVSQSTCAISMSEASTKRRRRTKPFAQKVHQSEQVTALCKQSDQYAKRNAMLCSDLMSQSKAVCRSRHLAEYRAWERAHNPEKRQKGVGFDYPSFDDPRDFMLHMGPRPADNHSVDRIDYNKPYQPGNLRWATKKEQAKNRSTSTRISWAGVQYTRHEFADFLGIPYSRLSRQINELKWSLSKIVREVGKEVDPVDGYQFPAHAREYLEREYYNRAMKSEWYYQFNRLDWLPHFYQDQYKAETRRKQKAQFLALHDDAERERQRRYAERSAIAAHRRDELLEQVTPTYPTFNPLPNLSPPPPAKPVNQAPAADCTKLERTALDHAKAEKAKEVEEVEETARFNAFLHPRVRQLVAQGHDVSEASQMALTEYRDQERCSEVDPSLHLDKPTECQP